MKKGLIVGAILLGGLLIGFMLLNRSKPPQQSIDEYYSEEYVKDAEPMEDSKLENSGGYEGLDIQNIDMIYDKIPLAIAVNIEAELNRQILVLNSIITQVENLAPAKLDEYIELNRDDIFYSFGIVPDDFIKKISQIKQSIQILEIVEVQAHTNSAVVTVKVIGNGFKVVCHIVYVSSEKVYIYWSDLI